MLFTLSFNGYKFDCYSNVPQGRKHCNLTSCYVVLHDYVWKHFTSECCVPFKFFKRKMMTGMHQNLQSRTNTYTPCFRGALAEVALD